MVRTVAVAAMSLGLAACGSQSPTEGTASDPATITVFAAASLRGTFTEIGKQFEAANEGVRVTFNFAGSADLVAQIQQGAPADVFASADTKQMDKAASDTLIIDTPVNFAANTLAIATPPDNPAGIDALDDLTAPGTKVVLCAAEVPCGAAAQAIEHASGIDISPVSEEQSVTDVLGKVISGEADAGLVYITDVREAGNKVHGIELPAAATAVNTYPIAALSGSPHPEIATRFVAFVAGSAGQAVLAAAGFSKP